MNELLRLISSWKSDLATSLAALELLRGLARINIPEQGLILFESFNIYRRLLQNYIGAYVFLPIMDISYIYIVIDLLFHLMIVTLCEHLLFLYSIKQKQNKFGDLVIFFSRILKFFKNLIFLYF